MTTLEEIQVARRETSHMLKTREAQPYMLKDVERVLARAYEELEHYTRERSYILRYYGNVLREAEQAVLSEEVNKVLTRVHERSIN